MQHNFYTVFHSRYILTYCLVCCLRMKGHFEEGSLPIDRYYIGPRLVAKVYKHTMTTTFSLLTNLHTHFLRHLAHTFFSQ